MKKLFLDNAINLIKNNNNFDVQKLAYIRYGLEGVYLTVTKLVIILVLSVIFNLTKEFIVFAFLYNIIRMFAFGMHAPKSYICLILSSFIFLFFPYLATILNYNFYINLSVGIFCVTIIIIYAPADTYKRPLIKKKKRIKLKFLAFFVSIIYLIISLIIKNAFMSNCLIFALLAEAILILPITYKIFKLPYNNYKNYYRKTTL